MRCDALIIWCCNSLYPIMMLSLPYSRLALRGSRSIASTNNALVSRRCGGLRLSSSQQTSTNATLVPSSYYFGSAFLLAGATLLYTTNNINDKSNTSAQCSAASPLGSEPVMLSPTKEPATGILFPSLCNGMSLVGCGVRVKWGFVKVSIYILCVLFDIVSYII